MPSLTEKLYTVCIGVNRCPRSKRLKAKSLDYAEKDAVTVCQLLLQMGVKEDNACLLTGKKATLEAINSALRTWVVNEPEPDDLVLVYFAGHGLPLLVKDGKEKEDTHSEVFLAPYDFDERRILEDRGFRLDEALGLERLRNDFFVRTLSHKVLFIFDSCYSGDFFGPKFRSSITDPVQGYIKHIFASTTAGARIALSSCLPTQEARESKQFGHGLFTHYLLEALRGNAREAIRHTGCVTVGSLFDYISEQLPDDQKPVRSGVEQDAFKLVCYPDKAEPIHPPTLEPEDTKRAEREDRLRAMFANHSGFMQDRLSSFVGRQSELIEIRRRINTMLSTGGYITITGQAGQGKSSLIAKLVQEYNPEKVAHHFIPLNPGPDYQVNLLRDLMARLILKYHLSDLYLSSESRPVLRTYLPRVLLEIAAKNGQEVIFIDGLDQLKEDLDGERDLSFLPINVPEGVVFVLGTRPNETLEPLKLLKPYDKYNLPNLSRQDFDLILDHRGVKLNKALIDQFYRAMQENALYLDLVAKELAQDEATTPEEIIKQIADNPENIFSLSMARLKRHAVEWNEVLKPILGVLLAAREPLTLRHIRQIIGVDQDRSIDGLARLGGLIADDGKQRYALFHLKLYDYLRQDSNRPNKEYIFATDEEENWHKALVGWCEGADLLVIWEDVKHEPSEQARREYARWHYITHLYFSHDWTRLFALLNEGKYGQSKVRYDLSTRSYAQDLDYGRHAAAWEEWPLEKGLEYLPNLWRYTLLRCSLASKVDRYPLAAFRLLLLLKRKQEALDLAELLTNPVRKVSALIEIAKQIGEQTDGRQEQFQVFLRAHEVANLIEESRAKAEALFKIGEALIQTQNWKRAEVVWAEAQDVIRTIKESKMKAETQAKLYEALTRAQQWERAKVLINTIEESRTRAEALQELVEVLPRAQQWEPAEAVWALTDAVSPVVEERFKAVIYTLKKNEQQFETLIKLGEVLIRAQQWERAQVVWEEAETLIHAIEESRTRVEALIKLGEALIRAQQWERAQVVWEEAETLIHTIEESRTRVEALIKLGEALIHAQQWEQVEGIWEQVESAIHTIEESKIRSEAWRELGETLVRAQQWEHAENVIYKIEEESQKVVAMIELGEALAQAQQWEQAEGIWMETFVAVDSIVERGQRVWVLGKLGESLTRVQKWELIENAWVQIEKIISEIEEPIQQMQAAAELDTARAKLSEALIRVQQWEQAKAVINKIGGSWIRAKALHELGEALAEVQQWEQAEGIWEQAVSVIHTIEESKIRSEAWRELGETLVRAQQWERAKVIVSMIEEGWMRAEALRELGEELALVQQWGNAEAVWAEAEAVIRTIEESATRAQTLRELGEALARAHQWKRAEDVWLEAEAMIHTIEEPDQKAWALGELCKALIRTQQWEMAEVIIQTIPKRNQRARMSHELGEALSQVQQWERARAIIYTIEDDWLKAEALRELGEALARTQQWEYAKAVWSEAEAMIRALLKSEQRTHTSEKPSKALVQEQEWETVEVVWAEAKALIHTVEERAKEVIYSMYERNQRTSISEKPSKTLLQTQQWERAKSVWAEAKAVIRTVEERAKTEIRKIEEHAKETIYALKGSEQRAEALGKLGEALARAQQWERAELVWAEAEAVIRSVEERGMRAEALLELSDALAQAQQWERAETVRTEAEAMISAVEERNQRAEVLHKLSETLARVQQWEHAEAVIHSIEEHGQRTEALEKLGEALAQAQQWERAEAVIRTIDENWTRARALSELSEALAQAQQWERAEAVIRTIKKSDQKAWALEKLSKALAQAQQWERAEAVIHMIEEPSHKATRSTSMGTK